LDQGPSYWEVRVSVQKRFDVSLAAALLAALLALAIVALVPSKANALGTFSGGVLTVDGGEGKIVPRCANDGEITVSGVPVDNEPAFCRDLTQVVVIGSDSYDLFDFSYLPDDLGGGQGPIELTAIGNGDSDKLIPALNHINVFNGGKGSDAAVGGNLNDRLSGGPAGDKLDGAGGKDILKGGPGGDSLTGGPGRDILKGGPGGDGLSGGPGKDIEKP
jgi:Ca2+-binding RTX toxin-like protein